MLIISAAAEGDGDINSSDISSAIKSVNESQSNIEVAEDKPAISSDAPAEVKKPRKRSAKPKTEAETSAENTSESDSTADAEPKKPRKRSAKPKAETENSAENIAEADSGADAEPKKPRKRSAKPKAEALASVAEDISADSGAGYVGESSDEALPELDDIFTPIKEEDVPTPSDSEDEDSPIIITSTEQDEATVETVGDTDGKDEDSEFVIPLFPASTYFSEDAADEAEATALEEETDEDEDIVHPDELFSVRDKRNEPQTEHVASDDESAHVDEDGQYVIPELDEHEEPEEELYAEDIPPEKYDPKKPRKIDGRFDFAELFVFTLLAVMIVTSFFFRHSVVQGDSMMNTLYDGEHLIISDFFYTPERGDIVVCQDHTARLNTPIVKRIIAIGGDTIKITPTAIYVNGEMLDEDYVFIDPYAMPYRYEPMAEMTVPEGEIFVMGDHRNNSKDSRDKIDLGTVSEDAILGRVLLRFYPFDKFGAVE